jgi:translation elongation factor P/translation initiation factor 5A
MNTTSAASFRKGQAVTWQNDGATYYIVNPPRVHPGTGELVARITLATPHGGFWVEAADLQAA